MMISGILQSSPESIITVVRTGVCHVIVWLRQAMLNPHGSSWIPLRHGGTSSAIRRNATHAYDAGSEAERSDR